jgi:hypothetical protein
MPQILGPVRARTPAEVLLANARSRFNEIPAGAPIRGLASTPYAERPIPYPRNDGSLVSLPGHVHEAQDPMRWVDMTANFDVRNIGSTSQQVGAGDLSWGRQIPTFATPNASVLGGRRSIRDCCAVASGGEGLRIVPRDAGNLVRGQILTEPRSAGVCSYFSFYLADLIRNWASTQNIGPEQLLLNSMTPMGNGQPTPRGRVRTLLEAGYPGLWPGTQFDISILLSVTSSQPRVRPLLPLTSSALGIDGAFAAVGRMASDSQARYSFLPDVDAPAFGMACGNNATTVRPGMPVFHSFSAGGNKMVPFAGTLRTLGTSASPNVDTLSGSNLGRDPVSVMDGLDIRDAHFTMASPGDYNREMAERYISNSLTAPQPYFPMSRVRLTLSFISLPANLDQWTARPGADRSAVATNIWFSVAAHWLEQLTDSEPQASGNTAARYEGRLFKKPAFLSLQDPLIDGVDHNINGGPDSTFFPRLYGPDFDFGVAVGAMSARINDYAEVIVRPESVHARYSLNVAPNGSPLSPGVPVDSYGVTGDAP